MDGEPLVKLDKSKLDEMDRLANEQAAKESAELLNVTKTIADAAKSAGIQSGQVPTQAQNEAMLSNMKQAMFPMIKQQILQEEAGTRFIANCLDKADTLKAANLCNQQAEEQYPSEEEEMEDFDEWNPSIKKEVLGEINTFLSSIDCIKAANDMSELEKCGFGQ